MVIPQFSTRTTPQLVRRTGFSLVGLLTVLLTLWSLWETAPRMTWRPLLSPSGTGLSVTPRRKLRARVVGKDIHAVAEDNYKVAVAGR